MNAEKLLPCPFCGGDDLVVRQDISEDEPKRWYAYHVFCRICHCHGRNNFPIGWAESPDAAHEAWNKRALSQAGAGGGVVVKPLEWDVVSGGGWQSADEVFKYQVFKHSGRYAIHLGEMFVNWCDSPDAAKAAAQANYSDRILAALAPSPSAGEPAGWVVGSTFFKEDPGALSGKQAVFLATPPATPVQPTASVGAVRAALLEAREYAPRRDGIVGRLDAALASLTPAPTQGGGELRLQKRPVEFRVLAHGNWLHFEDEQMAQESAEMHGVDYQGLYVRDGSPLNSPSPVSAPSPAGGVREGRRAIIHAVASLAAAISLLERTPKAKKAAPSDRMFDQMLKDYRKALDEARAALSSPATPEPVSAPANGEVVEAARAVLEHRRGSLPRDGGLRDNDASRAALERLSKALSNPAPGHGEGTDV